MAWRLRRATQVTSFGFSVTPNVPFLQKASGWLRHLNKFLQ